MVFAGLNEMSWYTEFKAKETSQFVFKSGKWQKISFFIPMGSWVRFVNLEFLLKKTIYHQNKTKNMSGNISIFLVLSFSEVNLLLMLIQFEGHFVNIEKLDGVGPIDNRPSTH